MEHLFDQFLQPIVRESLALLVALALGLLARWIHKRTGIEVSRAVQDRARDAALQAVLAVEEIAMAQAKKGVKQWLGERKHKEAIDLLLGSVPALSYEKARDLVYWAVARVPGLGATGVLGDGKAAGGAS